MRRFFSMWLVVLALGCHAADESVAASSEAIIQGVRETNYPEVVALYWSSGASSGALCSGTVIGQYAVLTAKHCVFRRGAGGAYEPVPPHELSVFVAHDINSMAGIMSGHRVHEIRTTSGTNVDDDVSAGNDIAIVLLTAAIPVTPRGFATSGPSVGAQLTIVGFGRTSATNPDATGVKYRGTTSIERVYERLIETRGTGMSWTCQGDSGGPAIDGAGNVTGITSFGLGDCTNPYSYFTRVSAHRALVEDALRFVPPCIPMAEACNGEDDDCDDAVDETRCTELGEPCASHMECMQGACEDIHGARICAESCFPDDPRDASCPLNTYCEAVGCGIGRCVAGSLGAAEEGAICRSHLDCASGNCAMVGSEMRCGRQCFPDTGCPGELVCEVDDACGVCVPREFSSLPRRLGEPCTEDARCESGACSEGVCVNRCTSSAQCPPEQQCRAEICVPGTPSPSPSGSGSSGCSAAFPGRGASSHIWALLVGIVLWARCRPRVRCT
jgi:hypothetical protein